MSYYDALVAKWPSVSGATIPEKLASINSETVRAGQNKDIPVGAIEAHLAMGGRISAIEDFLSAAPRNGAPRTAAIELLRLINSKNVALIQTSNPATRQKLVWFLDALVGESLITLADRDEIIEHAAPQATPWWSVAGYSSPLNEHDLVTAGIYAHADAHADGFLASPDPEHVGDDSAWQSVSSVDA